MRRAAVVAVLALLLAACASSEPTPRGLIDNPKSNGHGKEMKPHGKDPKPKDTTPVDAEEVVGESLCFGDGQDGNRVQAVYLVADGKPDRYATVAGQVRTWAAGMDQAVNDSAALDGGTSHIRWACSAGAVDVAHVNVSGTEDDTIQNIRTALGSRGYNRTDRKYVIWADTTDGGYCGISFTYSTVDYAPTYSQVNVGCWGYATSVELHELTHALGAVRLSAPHSNGTWHCLDDYDRMCYNDGSGGTFTYTCDSTNERLLDCHHDDYASWKADSTIAGNVARSTYLVSTFGGASPSPTPTAVTASPTPTVTPTPTPSATPSPTPSATPTAAVSVDLSDLAFAAVNDPKTHTSSHPADVKVMAAALIAERLLASTELTGRFSRTKKRAYAKWQASYGLVNPTGIPDGPSLTRLGTLHGFTVTP